MEKIILQSRQEKEVKLPKSGATLRIYASPLVKDLEGIDFKGGEMQTGMKMIVRLIKEWNVYASQDDAQPLPVTEETVGNLPVEDLTFLTEQIEVFATEQKKS